MSTTTKKLTKDELAAMAAGQPSLLTTKEAAALLRVAPKTINAWKNAKFLEGTYRQQRGEDRYVTIRLLKCFFDGPQWND